MSPPSSVKKVASRASSETPVDFQRTTGRYIPEDRPLQKLYYFRGVFNDAFSVSRLYGVGWYMNDEFGSI
jgi:hypothetical protein